MSQISKIEWTEATWNPATGCTKISEGCKHCYAERLAARLKAMGNVRYKKGFQLNLHEDLLGLPLKWKQPKMIFVNSMSDLFHEEIPLEFISKVLETMKKASWHTFQILTKRSERLKLISQKIDWPDNVWIGVTVESNKYVNRIKDLQEVKAHTKFISVEPLLAPLYDLSLKNIDWVIVGGESGPNSRKINIEWVRSIRDQCVREKVAFFFKQWGGVRKKASGRLLDGKYWNERP